VGELEVKWSIEAPTEALEDAMAEAAIDANAIEPGVIDAELHYPSFFCSSRSAWMKALAYLYVRNIEFKLFLFATTETGAESWRYRLQPGMDREMLALMREIDAREVMQLEQIQTRIESALEILRAKALDETDLI